jgi:hypothetical protein
MINSYFEFHRAHHLTVRPHPARDLKKGQLSRN